MRAPGPTGNIEDDIDNFFRSGDFTVSSGSVFDFVKAWVERAIDETKGMHTDTEYLTGKTKEEFLKDNGFL